MVAPDTLLEMVSGDVAAGIGLIGGATVLICGVVLAIGWSPRRLGRLLAGAALLLLVAGTLVTDALDKYHLEDSRPPACLAPALEANPSSDQL